jgi:nucleoside 2-deoxyribosyltransferase
MIRWKDEGATMKIYMAGPLFSTAELAFNRELAGLLRKQGHEVFLPQEHEQRKDLPRAIFESDVKGLDWADTVVACLDGADPDSGTCWELGYAYAMKKNSIVYRTDFRLFEGTDPINLMMTESANHVIIMPMASVADLAAEIGRLLDALSNGTR